MKNLVRTLCLVLSIVIVTTSCATAELTEKTVKQLISRVDDASNNLDATAVAKEMSDDISITINIAIQGNQQVMKPSKQEYISLLEQGWAQYTNYKYNRSNTIINIVENKAFVSADVHELMTIQGQNISGASKEQVIIELVNGVPLITEVTTHTNM